MGIVLVSPVELCYKIGTFKCLCLLTRLLLQIEVVYLFYYIWCVCVCVNYIVLSRLTKESAGSCAYALNEEYKFDETTLNVNFHFNDQ